MFVLFENLSQKAKIIAVSILLLTVVGIIAGVAYFIIDNSYPVVIQNLNDYMGSISNKDKRALNEAVSDYLDEYFDINETPEDVYIRENTFSDEKSGKLTIAHFIIDIDSLKISYQIDFTYPYGDHTSVNPVFNCPSLTETRYPETECVGTFNSSSLVKAEQDNPVNKILPIKVDSKEARYDIFGFFDQDNGNKFSLNIVDYSCNNREKALELIRSKGFNPDDYTVNYQDECITKHLPYVGINTLGNKFRVSMTTTDEGKYYFMIDNYSCGNQKNTENSSLKAASDWLHSRGLTLTNYEYGILTFCNK